MTIKDLHLTLAKGICLTVLLSPLLAAVTAVAQQSATNAAVPSQTANGPNGAKPQTPGRVEVTKVEFVRSYQMLNKTVTALPDDVIAVVQTSEQWASPRPISEWTKLTNYVFQYTTADSRTGFAPGLAVGSQMELANGQMLQVWADAEGGRLNYGVASHYIDGLTVLAALPKSVTSFTLSIKDIAFVSRPIQRDSGKDSPAAK
jgi:hypothetical protein